MESFRLAGSIDQFLNDLKSLKKTGSSVTLWQTINKRKEIVKAKYASHKQEKERTIVSFDLNKVFGFSQTQPIFIFEEKKGLLFKGEYEYCVNKKLKVIIDDKVFLKEKRRGERFSFHYSEVKLDLLFPSGSPNKDIKLKDVSSYGYSFLIAAMIAKSFKLGDEIGITSINGLKLPKAIPGKIIHLTGAKKTKEKNQYKVGVAFNRKSKIFTEIIEQMREG